MGTVETANSIVAGTASVPASVPSVVTTQNKALQGSVLVLIQFDVCEEINLDALRDIFGARRQEASFKHPAPGYVRFERAPVVEPVEPLILESGERLDVQIFQRDGHVLIIEPRMRNRARSSVATRLGSSRQMKSKRYSV